jgi:protein TonB
VRAGILEVSDRVSCGRQQSGLGVTMKKYLGVFAAVAVAAGLSAAPAYAANDRELVEVEAPAYPRSAERREIEGHVVVRYNVTPDGAVEGVEVVEASPAGVFERSVMRALESWRYATAAETTEGVERRFDFNFGG